MFRARIPAMLLAGLALAGGAAAQNPPGELAAVELSTIGLDRLSGTPIVLLREPASETVLPIWIGSAEARAIALVLHGVVVPRPMTHDLMANLLAELDAELEEVVITDLRNNIYFGVLRLRVDGSRNVREVDTRPSDALALALRTGAPIRVARRILLSPPEFEFVAPEGPNQIAQALGVTVVSAGSELRKEFGLGDREGVVVTSAFGKARDQGLRRGDLIQSINGVAVHDPVAFLDAVRAAPKGQLLRIAYWRGGTARSVELPADLPAPVQRRGRRQAI